MQSELKGFRPKTPGERDSSLDPRNEAAMWNRYWRESLRLGKNWEGCQACPPEKRDPEALLQVNHVISKQRLKRFCKEHGQGPGYLLLLLTDPRNSMLVDESCHEGHTTGMRPIPREAIPNYAWEFAKEKGLEQEVLAEYPRGDR